MKKTALVSALISGLLLASFPAFAKHEGNFAVECALRSLVLKIGASRSEDIIKGVEELREREGLGRLSEAEREQMKKELDKTFFNDVSHVYWIVDKPEECPSSQNDRR